MRVGVSQRGGIRRLARKPALTGRAGGHRAVANGRGVARQGRLAPGLPSARDGGCDSGGSRTGRRRRSVPRIVLRRGGGVPRCGACRSRCSAAHCRR